MQLPFSRDAIHFISRHCLMNRYDLTEPDADRRMARPRQCDSEYVSFELSKTDETSESVKLVATAHATEAFWLLGDPSLKLISNWKSDKKREETDVLAEVDASYYPLEDRIFIHKFASASRIGMTIDQQVAVRGKATALFCYLLSQDEGDNLIVELEASGRLANHGDPLGELAKQLPITEIEHELAQSPAALAAYLDDLGTTPTGKDLRKVWLGKNQTLGLSAYYARKFGFEQVCDVLEDFWYIAMKAHKDTIFKAYRRQSNKVVIDVE